MSFEKIRGMRWTDEIDRRTDGWVQQLMRPAMVTLSTTLQYTVNERYVKCATDRQADKYQKNEAFLLVKCIRRYV